MGRRPDWRSLDAEGNWADLVGGARVSAPAPAGAESPAFEYPSAVLDAYDADGSCWTGMDAAGAYPVQVVPEQWLVGPPPSQNSAVTLPADHWMDLAFSGRLVAGDGNDIVVVENGKSGEQALLFVTDGADQEYLLTKLSVDNSMKQELSYFSLNLEGVVLPFVPRAVRLVGLDLGGQSPGFDLSNVRARVAHDGGAKACCPNPVSGAAGVSPYVKLSWSPGDAANRHVIHFGELASPVGLAGPDDPQPPPPVAGCEHVRAARPGAGPDLLLADR